MKISIIGAGNGGQAISGYLSCMGYDVGLYDRDEERINTLRQKGGIQLEGRLHGFGKVSCITTDISEAVSGADIVMVTTVANAHANVARSVAPYLADGQVIILSPGRTCGAIVFNQALKESGCNKRIYLAEAQTLVYACRIIEDGHVNVIGIKDEVLLSAFPSSDTDYVLEKINPIYPCFEKADNVLTTSLENIGAMFHPCVLLFNAATIERNETFWFYRDKYAYNETQGDTLCERMRNNPAYHDIKSPSTIFTRQLMEDIPTGVLPIMELGKAAGVKTPLLESMVNICEALLDKDLRSSGRTLKNLGLDGLTRDEIISRITHG